MPKSTIRPMNSNKNKLNSSKNKLNSEIIFIFNFNPDREVEN